MVECVGDIIESRTAIEEEGEMGVTPDTSQPLYLQIRQIMKEEINRGKYQMDQKMPTEAELCEIYQVSRITIRKAIEDLVKDGTLIRRQGKGTFVTSKKIENELLSVSGFSEFSHQLGATPHSRVLSSQVIQATEEIASRLGIDKDSPVLELERLMYVNDRPLFYDKAHYSLLRFPDLEKKIGQRDSTYKILQEDYNTKISTNDKIIDVIFAPKEIAQYLECDPGTSLFRITKTAYDVKDNLVHLSTFLCETSKVSLTVHRAPALKEK